jgi:hypothetical protein
MNLVEKRLGLLLNHFKNLLGHSFTLQGVTLAQDSSHPSSLEDFRLHSFKPPTRRFKILKYIAEGF